MPYKDREQKLARMREWRAQKMQEGYGVWLYRRRKLRFDDADRFRTAIFAAIDGLTEAQVTKPEAMPDRIAEVKDMLATALRESMEAEEALGPYQHKKEEETNEAR